MALMTSWLTVPLLVTSHGRSFWIKWMWTMDGHDELSFTFVNVHKLLSTLLLSHTKSEKNKQTKSTTTSLYWSSSPETPKRDISMTFLAQRKTLSLQLNPIHALNMWSWERSSGVASFFSCLSEDVSNWENQTYLFFFVCLCVFVWSFLSKKNNWLVFLQGQVVLFMDSSQLREGVRSGSVWCVVSAGAGLGKDFFDVGQRISWGFRVFGFWWRMTSGM